MSARSSSSSDGARPLASWVVVSPQGPALSHHVGAVIRRRFWVHGGIDKKNSTVPMDKIYNMDLTTGIWTECRAPNPPALSHHAAIVIEDRYLVLIGGWNGQKRCTDVFVFDTQEACWIPMETSGFPVGGGLSSHTATLLASGDVLIIGREGSARLQRKTGNAYMLRGSVHRGRFVYENHPIVPASRSGHSAHLLGGGAFLLYGGRHDDLLELHRRPELQSPGTGNARILMERVLPLCRQQLTPMPSAKIPGGRKHHIAVLGAGARALLIHGGETFDGKSRDAVGEIIVVLLKPHVLWYRLATTPEGRAGHVSVLVDDELLMHGGEGAKGVIYGATYRLDIHAEGDKKS